MKLQNAMCFLDTLILGLSCHANANVPYTTSQNLIFYSILTGIGTITSILLSTSYYCIWKYAFQLFPPLPFNGYVNGTISCILMYTAQL